MTTAPRRIDTGALFWGVLLIVAGLAFFADRLDFADFGDLAATWWPLFIVALGISKLFQAATVWSGLWLLTVGAWCQMNVLHAWDLSWRNSWPLLLIALGAGMIARAFVEALRRRQLENGEQS